MSREIKSNHEKFKQKSAKKIYSQFPKVSKRKRELEKASYLEQLSEHLSLPEDLLTGTPILNVMGRNQICLENYKGIIEYTGTIIKVQTKVGKITIEGEGLDIAYFTDDEMRISGLIHNIKYQ